MFNPSQWTLGEISSAVRDFGIAGSLAMFVWKTRGAWEHGKQFFQRLTSFMDFMEGGMRTLLDNHLKHIEADLAKLTGRKVE